MQQSSSKKLFSWEFQFLAFFDTSSKRRLKTGRAVVVGAPIAVSRKPSRRLNEKNK